MTVSAAMLFCYDAPEMFCRQRKFSQLSISMGLIDNDHQKANESKLFGHIKKCHINFFEC